MKNDMDIPDNATGVYGRYAIAATGAFAVGAGSRILGVTLPAPAAFDGVLLVASITVGYWLAGRYWKSNVSNLGADRI
jgi:XapX domain-containing protein